MDLDAQLVKPASQARVCAMVEDDKARVDRAGAAIDFNLVGVGVPTESMLGLQ